METVCEYPDVGPSTTNYERTSQLTLESPCTSVFTVSDQESYNVAQSMSGASNLSLSNASSPTFVTTSPETMKIPSNRPQWNWSTETPGSSLKRPHPYNQHHGHSCPKCSLSNAEVKKCKLERRRGQNRESQRKYRAKKDARIRESADQVATLESYVAMLEKHNNDLEVMNAKLQQKIRGLDSSEHGGMADGNAPGVEQVPTNNLDVEATGIVPVSVNFTPTEGLGPVWTADMFVPLFNHGLLLPC